MCLTDKEFDNRVSGLFLRIGYSYTYSHLRVLADELHERRTLERETKIKAETEKNESIITSDDKITLCV